MMKAPTACNVFQVHFVTMNAQIGLRVILQELLPVNNPLRHRLLIQRRESGQPKRDAAGRNKVYPSPSVKRTLYVRTHADPISTVRLALAHSTCISRRQESNYNDTNTNMFIHSRSADDLFSLAKCQCMNVTRFRSAIAGPTCLHGSMALFRQLLSE